MAGFPLDLVDPIQIGLGNLGDLDGALLANIAGGFLGDRADTCHALGSEGLDFEPDAEPVLGRPNRGHLGTGITRDHGNAFLCQRPASEPPGPS